MGYSNADGGMVDSAGRPIVHPTPPVISHTPIRDQWV